MNREVIFDAVRQMLGRGFRDDEIEALDRAIEAALSNSALKREIGSAGIALIQKWEGCARARPDGLFEAYPDPGSGDDPWTIGWGSTGADVVPGLIWSQEQCDARLKRDLVRYARDVANAVGAAPTKSAGPDEPHPQTPHHGRGDRSNPPAAPARRVAII